MFARFFSNIVSTLNCTVTPLISNVKDFSEAGPRRKDYRQNVLMANSSNVCLSHEVYLYDRRISDNLSHKVALDFSQDTREL